MWKKPTAAMVLLGVGPWFWLLLLSSSSSLADAFVLPQQHHGGLFRNPVRVRRTPLEFSSSKTRTTTTTTTTKSPSALLQNTVPRRQSRQRHAQQGALLAQQQQQWSALFAAATARNTRLQLFSSSNDDDESDEDADEEEEEDEENDDDDDDSVEPRGLFRQAVAKFRARPGTYLFIPVVAAFVGWLTNWLAVQMIFYPIGFWGIPLWRRPEVPLGLLGWQGIIPCKTRTMSEAMVNMVTTQLLSMEEVFRRLDPRQIATLLAPEVPKLGQDILADVLPKWVLGVPKAIFLGLPIGTRSIIRHMNHRFLRRFTEEMQNNVADVFSVRNCVVNQMLNNRAKLGELFRICGQAELDFLTNSGLWFGFLLGILQMMVALVWENPWSLSIGGGIVGLATNWLALKWIFEPVNPTRIGPFVLQGQFLRRQPEVAREFSHYFANQVLGSEKMWHSILTDPQTKPAFTQLFEKHLIRFVSGITGGLAILTPSPAVLKRAAKRAVDQLPQHIGVVHPYVNSQLGLQQTLQTQMENMSSEQFERVLHPIFEEDELTLILAGAALGFAAGLIQQGLETGRIPTPQVGKYLQRTLQQCQTLRRKIQVQWLTLATRLRVKLQLRLEGNKNKDENGEDDSPWSLPGSLSG